MKAAPDWHAEGKVSSLKYQGVHDALVALIKSLPDGAALPTERELCERYHVSRSTVRQALAQLEVEQKIYRRQGKGTFVARAKIEQRLELMSHTEGMRARGISPSSKLIDVRRVTAGVEIGPKLGLLAEAEVLRIERLRLADGDPIAIEVLYLNADRFDGIAAALGENGSLYQLLSSNYGIELASAEESIEAVAAERREADLLACAQGTPLLMLSRRTLDTDGQPTEFVRSLYRGDRFRFQTGLERPRNVVSSFEPPSRGPSLRVARTDDARAMARVFIDAWRSAYPGVVADSVLEGLNEDDTVAWLANLIGASATATVVAELTSGQIVGFARFGDDVEDPRCGHLYSLYVAPEVAGQGVGRTLLERALAELDPVGERHVTLWVFEGNDRAQSLYQAAGFRLDDAHRTDQRYGAREVRMCRGAAALTPSGADQLVHGPAMLGAPTGSS